MLTKEQLDTLVDDTLAWGSEVADLWAGTQFEDRIDFQQAQLIKATEAKDYEIVERLVFDLAQLLDHAEREYGLKS